VNSGKILALLGLAGLGAGIWYLTRKKKEAVAPAPTPAPAVTVTKPVVVAKPVVTLKAPEKKVIEKKITRPTTLKKTIISEHPDALDEVVEIMEKYQKTAKAQKWKLLWSPEKTYDLWNAGKLQITLVTDEGTFIYKSPSTTKPTHFVTLDKTKKKLSMSYRYIACVLRGRTVPCWYRGARKVTRSVGKSYSLEGVM